MPGSDREPRRARNALALLMVLSALLPHGAALGGSPHGIDVSHHQGRIRWQRVSRAGVDFAFLKATEGMTVKDTRYHRNRKRAERVGIKVGAYHFARPGGAEGNRIRKDARWEARWFLRVARPKKRNLRPVLDLETSGPLGRRDLVKWTDEWVSHVHTQVGVRPIVYSGPTFWQDRMRGSERFARTRHPLWVAHYTRKAPDVPARGWRGKGWTFWQWTDCGRVRGVKGCVDRNRFAGRDLTDLEIGTTPSRSKNAARPARGKTKRPERTKGKKDRSGRRRDEKDRSRVEPKRSTGKSAQDSRGRVNQISACYTGSTPCFRQGRSTFLF